MNSKASVLVIEDQPTVQMMLSDILSVDCEVSVAGRGDVALALAADMKPDIIILDVGLPDMTGFEVCRRLKADPRTKRIPIIFLTGHNSEEKELRGLEAGGIDYLTKPINVFLLRARLKNHIAERHEQQRAIAQAVSAAQVAQQAGVSDR